MKYPIILLLSLALSVTAYGKPNCQRFNNYDNKVTIVFTDDEPGDRYTVTDVKLIPSRKETEYKATSISTTVENGVATVNVVFPHITQFSNPKVSLRINGKKRTFKVSQ